MPLSTNSSLTRFSRSCESRGEKLYHVGCEMQLKLHFFNCGKCILRDGTCHFEQKSVPFHLSAEFRSWLMVSHYFFTVVSPAASASCSRVGAERGVFIVHASKALCTLVKTA